MWLGKLNCPSVGDPSDFTQLYNCLTVGYIFSWVITCQIDRQNLTKNKVTSKTDQNGGEISIVTWLIHHGLIEYLY